MRFCLALLTICGFLLTSPASGERIFPYKAFITTDEVYVRSGPGQSYYPTEKLKAGQEIDVYRHDPGGWYAIRPVDGSFAWVSGRYLQAGVDNLAVVTADGVAARVGSRFSDVRDVIQVRLHKGEVVEVLESKKLAGPSETTTWHKIAPPSGEFRWVFGKYVDADYPTDGVRKTHAAENRTVRIEQSPGNNAVEPAADASIEEPPSFVRQSVEPRPVQTLRPAEPAVPRGLTPEEFQAELDEIDVQLATMVVEEPTVWAFDDLRRRCESLMAEAETAIERGHARILIGKMARFEDIKRRYDDVLVIRAETEQSNEQLAGLRSVHDRAVDETPPAEDGRFDGTGKLARVAAQKLGTPRYALVGEQGEVRCYVSPAPGVHLRHYLGRQIGINGTRGYMPEQRANHVMARHVSLLEGQRFH